MNKKYLSIGLVAVLLSSILAWAFLSPSKVVQQYKVLTPLKQLKSEQIEQVVTPYIGQQFWRLNLEKIHAELVRLDWVYKAEVTRKWPSKIIIRIEEQNPVVRWDDAGLLNQQGEIFYPSSIVGFEAFVKLKGEAEFAKDLLQKLVIFQKNFDKLNWIIKEIEQQADGGWLLSFVAGKQVIIGTEDWQDKLDLFTKAYPKVKSSLRTQAQRYDLRYSNGFVVKLKAVKLKSNPSKDPEG